MQESPASSECCYGPAEPWRGVRGKGSAWSFGVQTDSIHWIRFQKMALMRAIGVNADANRPGVEPRVGLRKNILQKWSGLNTEAERGTSSPEGEGEGLALSRREHILHLQWAWGQGWHSCCKYQGGEQAENLLLGLPLDSSGVLGRGLPR